jgi:hypothetical protein
VRLSRGDIGAQNVQILAGGFKGLLGLMTGDEAGIVVEGQVALPSKPVENTQQAGVPLVEVGTREPR